MSAPISQITTGVPNGTIELPATNPLVTTESPNGTTFKYLLSDIQIYFLRAEGYDVYEAVVVATTANLNANYANGAAGVGATLTNAGAQAALSVDSITLSVDDRVLVKNQSNNIENGIYIVTTVGSATTNWVLTRAIDYNEPADIIYLGVIPVNRGVINAGYIFQENSPGPFTIGVSPITFQQLTVPVGLLPSASPANKMLRSDGTYWVQSTNSELSASDVLSGLTQLDVDNIRINGNSIISTDANGDIILTPNGTGDLVLDGLNWPQVDGTNGQAVTTNGIGQLGWTSFGAPYTPAALTSTSDTNVTITLGGTPATALLQATSITMGWSGQLGITRGGTNTNLLGANGQLAQSDGTKYSWTTATYPSTATSTGTILRADGTNWVATTATYPATTTINQILYSSANNVIGEITTANNGVLITSAGGVPSISSTLPTAVQGNITSVGTIVSGTWNGGIIGSAYGGTGINNGASTITLGGSLTTSGAFASTFTMTNTTAVTFPTSGTLATTSQLPTPAAMTRVDDTNVTLTLGGTPATSLLQAVSLTLGWTGQLGVSRGGTGASAVGANGTLAQSNGSIYTFTTATYPSTTTANRLLYSSATNTVTDLATANSATLVTDATGVPAWTSSMTNGQVLIGSTGATPVPATITGTAGITVTGGAGTITISGGGGGYTWTEVTGTTQSMAVNSGYITNNPAVVTLTLPTTAALGSTISIAGKGAGGWKIAQNAGQEIFFGTVATTIGVTGFLQSTQQFDSIELLCITADTQWTVITGPLGAITYA